MSDKEPNHNQQPDSRPPDTTFQEEYIKHELAKIDRMTISDLLKFKRTPPSQSNPFEMITPFQQAKMLNEQLNVQGRYLGQRTPGEIWVNLNQQAIDMKSADLHEQRVSKTLNYAKRGRLGIDLYLIGFATLGIIGIPLYFYFVGRKQRQRKVNSRKLTPSQIKNLDEDSPIGIDEVSEQVIMYYNPQREAMRREERRRREQHQRILRQIEEM